MFPIGEDDGSRRTVPLVTYALIALNVLFFCVELSGGDAFIEKWAFSPSRTNKMAVLKKAGYLAQFWEQDIRSTYCNNTIKTEGLLSYAVEST